MEQQTEQKKSWTASLPYLTFVFLTCCVVGWIFEVCIEFSWGHGFVNRGFLFGPYLPVYGFGGLICMAFLLKMVQKKPFGRFGTPVAAFVLFALITSAIELVTALLLKHFLNMQMWDYSTHWMNFRGMVSPLAAFRFAIGGMALLYIVCPAMDAVCHRLKAKTQAIAAGCIAAVMLVDTVFSFYVHAKGA